MHKEEAIKFECSVCSFVLLREREARGLLQLIANVNLACVVRLGRKQRTGTETGLFKQRFAASGDSQGNLSVCAAVPAFPDKCIFVLHMGKMHTVSSK